MAFSVPVVSVLFVSRKVIEHRRTFSCQVLSSSWQLSCFFYFFFGKSKFKSGLADTVSLPIFLWFFLRPFTQIP